MKTTSWFSTERHETAVVDVHHHNTSCRDGKKVSKNYRRHGTDNRPLCKECARLDSVGR